MLTNNQDQFTKWLQNKSINDYWSGQSVDHTYSSTQLAHFRGLLENKELFPSSVTLFVSNACNLYCKHCGQSSGKALSLSEEIENIEDARNITRLPTRIEQVYKQVSERHRKSLDKLGK